MKVFLFCDDMKEDDPQNVIIGDESLNSEIILEEKSSLYVFAIHARIDNFSFVEFPFVKYKEIEGLQ